MQHAKFLIAQHRAGARNREPVLAKWSRELRKFVCFPVIFRWRLDRAPFMVTSLFVLYYVIAPGAIGDERYGTALGYMKYLFATLSISCFVLLAVVRQRINLSPAFPVAALFLSVAGGISFTYSIVMVPDRTTYASALIPLIVAAMPLVIPIQATRTDGTAVTEYLFRIFGLVSLFHVLWQTTDHALGLGEYYSGHHEVGVLIADFMILSGLFRRYLLLALSIGLVALSLLLRPSSTVGFSAIFAIAFIVLYRLPYRRLLRVACVLVVGIIIAGNLAIFISDDVARAIYSIEPLLKEDALESHSNNEFRLGIISATRDEMAERSLLVGKFFSGAVNVNANKYLSYIEDTSQAPIHSDFIVMLQQSGLIGYGLFATLLIGVARMCAKAARLAHAAGDGGSETLFDALLAMNITFILCITANPVMQYQELTLPFFMLVPLTVFLARAQPGFAGSRRTNGAR